MRAPLIGPPAPGRSLSITTRRATRAQLISRRCHHQQRGAEPVHRLHAGEQRSRLQNVAPISPATTRSAGISTTSARFRISRRSATPEISLPAGSTVSELPSAI
jgi:hypothetical protein